MPAPVVSVTFTAPVPAGDSATIDVAEPIVNLFASFAPSSTSSAPVKLVPVIVTCVPPPRAVAA